MIKIEKPHYFDDYHFVLLVTVEFECTTYQGFAKSYEEAEEKINSFVKYARDNYCEHSLESFSVIRIAKRAIQKRRMKDLFFICCSCCAFGA
jgi:hypothetical protein